MHECTNDLLQVSYSSACLSDAVQRLPELFCMLPLKEYLTAGVAGLVTYFQWKKVLIVSQENNNFALVSPTVVIYIAISLCVCVCVCVCVSLSISISTNYFAHCLSLTPDCRIQAGLWKCLRQEM